MRRVRRKRARLASDHPAVGQIFTKPHVLIGVISTPSKFARREMIRDFANATRSELKVQTEFVFADRYFERPPPLDVQERLGAEVDRHGDAVFVDARERLPHVGKATEKSASWWLTAPLRVSANFYCKTDDDALLQDLQEADFNQSMQARASPPFAPVPPCPSVVGVARRPRAGRPSLFCFGAVQTRRLSLSAHGTLHTAGRGVDDGVQAASRGAHPRPHRHASPCGV